MRALEDVHWWYLSLRSLVLGHVRPGERVLDVGCGTGGMLARLGACEAYGVDLSRTALSHARGRGIRRLCRASAGSLPFGPDTFDTVISLDVIYHRAVADDARAVAECARVLRPGGTLLLHVPAFERFAGSHDRAVHGARRYTPDGVGRLVRSAGLEIGSLSCRNAFVLPFAAARRMGRKIGGASGGSDLFRLPAPVNALLASAGRAENALLRVAPIPFGLSVWCRATKPRREAAGASGSG
jgi:SAM-dependent methyltransferase